ncbi:hypothetical protein OY671_011691, partial [Metschnikowia pulcherrima]
MRKASSARGSVGWGVTTVQAEAAQSQTPPDSPETRQPPGPADRPSMPSLGANVAGCRHRAVVPDAVVSLETDQQGAVVKNRQLLGIPVGLVDDRRAVGQGQSSPGQVAYADQFARTVQNQLAAHQIARVADAEETVVAGQLEVGQAVQG